MSRRINRRFTVILALACMLLLISPVVLAAPFVKIETEGLKSLHIRANIIEKGGQAGQGAKNGRVQMLIREVEPQMYSYKFQINLRKAQADTEYGIHLWAQLDDIEFTIYGDTSPGSMWPFIEWLAYTHLDMDDEIDGQITTSLGELGLNEQMIELNSPETFTTDSRGSYKNIKSGIMTEDDAMEYVLDLVWPYFRQIAIDRSPYKIDLAEEVDFADLGIVGLKIHGDTEPYTFSMGVDFRNQEGGTNYQTEDITFTHTMNDFLWGVTP